LNVVPSQNLPPKSLEEGEEAIRFILEAARSAGATSADALYVSGVEETVGVRKGEIEKVQAAQSRGIGIRVFAGTRQSSVATRDLSPDHLRSLVARAVAMAQHTAEDPYAGLPDRILPPAIDPAKLFPEESRIPSRDELVERALATEKAALSFDPRITNSEGAECSRSHSHIVFGNSLGFLHGYRKGSYALSCSVIATSGDQMERDYWYVTGPLWEKISDAEAIGQKAASRTVRRLGARRIKTGTYPVIFDPETARSLVGHFAGAVSGSALYRNATYLKGREGTPVMNACMTLREDPFLPGAPGSRPFDGEGLPTRKKTLVDEGVLQTFLFDTYSARKLGRQSTANAVRSLGDGPGVGISNLIVDPGTSTLDDLMKKAGKGLLVTELIGFGVSTVTGDYSRGAFGYWFEDGAILHPVSEITLAGTLDEIYKNIVDRGSDLEIRSSINSPSLLVDGLRIAGD